MKEEHHTDVYLKNMAKVINDKVKEGYTCNFQATDDGLLCQETGETFKPDEIKVVDFFRFEGMSDPEDNSILYIVETNNDTKGTLVDAYGAYSDARVDEFIKKVEELHKKNAVNH